MKKFGVLFLIMIIFSGIAHAGKPIIETSKGYVGELPKLGKKIDDEKTESKTKPQYEKVKEFSSKEEIKDIPREDPAFVNIILKADKNTQYINDINDMLPMLEKIYNMIEDDVDVQKFVATTYFFSKNVEVLREKYENRPEFYFISFQKLLETDLQIQTVSNLRVEAVKNTPYMALGTEGKIYNSVNLQDQLSYLLKEIEETIMAIKNVY